MIKWIIRSLFSKEITAYVEEAREILSMAKQTAKKEYVAYEKLPLDSPAFIHSMQPVFTNKAVVCWLKSRQEEVYKTIKLGDGVNVQNFIGRALAIDAMLKDLEDFDTRYKNMLLDIEESKKAAINA